MNTLTRKIGPLPFWAWGVLGGAAIALGLYLRHRASGAAASSLAGDGTTLGDVTNSVAGGATAPPPSGLDPATADLLANAQNALVASTQAYSDAIAASAGGAVTTSSFDSGFGEPLSTNVSSSSGSGAGPPAATATTTSSQPPPPPAPTTIVPGTAFQPKATPFQIGRVE